MKWKESSIFCELLLVLVGIQPHDDLAPNVIQHDDSVFMVGTKETLFVVSWTLNYVCLVFFGMV